MCGLLGSGNIWLRYNYLNIWNLRTQKNINIEKIAFKIKFLAMHITYQNISKFTYQKFCYIYGKKCTKYLHGTWYLLNFLMK